MLIYTIELNYRYANRKHLKISNLGLNILTDHEGS
jgi:hypothetical protein